MDKIKAVALADEALRRYFGKGAEYFFELRNLIAEQLEKDQIDHTHWVKPIRKVGWYFFGKEEDFDSHDIKSRTCDVPVEIEDILEELIRG